MRKTKAKKSRARPWSEGEVKLLERLYHGDNAQSIAAKIGRSYRAVTVKAHKLRRTKELRFKLGLRKKLRYHEGHRVVNGTKEKLCGECEKWKAESQFCRNRRLKDGLQWRCKECEAEYDLKRYKRIRKDRRRYLRYEDRHRVVKGVRQKLCRKCNQWLNETGFHKRSSEKDGLAGRCKKCACEAARKCSRK